MRRYFLGLFALGLTTPVLAHDRAPERPAPDAVQVGALLSDPLVQDSIAATVDQFADALLQTHVGPLARYTDPRDNVRPNDTLADLAARDHRTIAATCDGTRSAVAATGQAARDMASLTAELQRTTERMRRVIDRTQAQMDAVR